MKKIIFFAILSLGFFQLSTAQVCKVVNRIHLEGDGRWDYITVDSETNTAYESHGDIVQIVDLGTAKTIGTINDLSGVHGVTIAKEFNKGFISNGRTSTVTVFELGTFKTLATIKVTGQNPDAILYDPFSKLVFTFNGKSNDATVIDPKTNEIKINIKLDGKPEFPQTDLKGKIYVNIEDKSEVQVIDTKTLKVVNQWSVAPGEEPSGLSLDLETNVLFSVCSNKMMVMSDAKSGKAIAHLPIGANCDGVAFDPTLKMAFSANGDGTITVVKEVSKDKFEVIENAKSQTSARTIAVNTKTHHLYLPAAEFNPKPQPTAENPKPRASMKPGSFVVLDVEAK
jgi:DNA-binding beta-propeller fold protein YncE